MASNKKKIIFAYNWLIQSIVGCSLFSCPGFRNLRNHIYKKYTGSLCSIGRHVTIWSQHNQHYKINCIGRVVINDNVYIDSTGNITIYNGVILSENASIFTHEHNIQLCAKGCCGFNPPVPTSLIIEKNVWIGACAIILPSCSVIGEGSIIGAGSVVTKNVLPYTVVVGNPAKEAKKIKH